MNVALSAVLIFILLIPPLALYLSYSFGRFPKAAPKFTLLEGLMASAVFSLLVHAIAVIFISKEIRFDILALISGGDLKSFDTKVSNAAFKSLLTGFAFYNLVLLVCSIILGRGLRWVVVKCSLHSKYELFRLYNRWYYYFNGYKPDGGDFDIIFVDALVNVKEGTMIYSGFLVDFDCEGEVLNQIYLRDAIKRDFKKHEIREDGNQIMINEPGEQKEIEGHSLCLLYENIINLNIHFISYPADDRELEETTYHATDHLNPDQLELFS
jgi:hypothetical protein